MSQLELPPPGRSRSDDSRWGWLANWIEGLLLFVGGVVVAYVTGSTDTTLDQIWRVTAVAAGALTLGFGAAYLFQQVRQNSEAATIEAEFEETSARIDALTADYRELERRAKPYVSTDRPGG